MSHLKSEDAERLRLHFEDALERSVRLRLVRGEGASSTLAREVLEEICALSERLTLRTSPPDRGGGGHGPVILLEGDTGGRVRFLGLPSGFEFPNLIEAIVERSRGVTALGETSRNLLKEVTAPLHLRVFTTAT